MTLVTKHYLITGRVQGVSYRATAAAKARQLGVTGWVRNLMDGRVEAVASASEQVLAGFERWLQQGPPGARVDHITASLLAEQSFTGFEIRSDSDSEGF